MSDTSMLHVRVDKKLKDNAVHALEAMGLTVSEAVRLFLKRVAIEQAFPLELKVPNSATLAAMEESHRIIVERRVRFANASGLFDYLEKENDLEKETGKF